jgi:hypothetical protein
MFIFTMIYPQSQRYKLASCDYDNNMRLLLKL